MQTGAVVTVDVSSGNSPSEIELIAMQDRVTSIEIIFIGSSFPDVRGLHLGPMVKFTKSSSCDTDPSNCCAGTADDYQPHDTGIMDSDHNSIIQSCQEMAQGSVTSACLELQSPLDGEGDVLKLDFGTNKPWAFMHAGTVHLCYAPNGMTSGEVTNGYTGPGHATALHVKLIVRGAQHSCNDAGCFSEVVYNSCFSALGKPCSGMQISTDHPSLSIVGNEQASLTKLLWGQMWQTSAKPDWQLDVYPELNGDGCFADTLDNRAGTPNIDVTTSSSDTAGVGIVFSKTKSATMPSVHKSSFTTSINTAPFALTLCFCANGACASYENYFQPIGRMLYWTINICDHGQDLSIDGDKLKKNPRKKVCGCSARRN